MPPSGTGRGGLLARLGQRLRRLGRGSASAANAVSGPDDQWRREDHVQIAQPYQAPPDPWRPAPATIVEGTPAPRVGGAHVVPGHQQPTLPNLEAAQGPTAPPDLFGKAPKQVGDANSTHVHRRNTPANADPGRPGAQLNLPIIPKDDLFSPTEQSTEEWHDLADAEADDVRVLTGSVDVDNRLAEIGSDPQDVPQPADDREVERAGDDLPQEVPLLESLAGDPWGPTETAEPGAPDEDSEFGTHIGRGDGFYEFDPGARQRPWEPTEEDEDAIAHAKAGIKAGAIGSLVDVTTMYDQKRLLNWLTELFSHLSHPSTFLAIKRAALGGVSEETLRAMVALRQCWLEHPEWWVGRYGFRREVNTLQSGRTALTWVLARRICEARAEYPPDAMIDPEWLDEWYELRWDEAGYYSFPSYVAVKVESTGAIILDQALASFERCQDGSEWHDDWNWYHRTTNSDEAIRYGFRFLTPFDIRENALSVGEGEEDE